MYRGDRESFVAFVSLTPRGNVPVAAPEPGSNERPSRRPPSAADVARARKNERERQLFEHILDFRRGGLADWQSYQTLSDSQIKIAFRIQSTIICMYDIYDAIQVLGGEDEEVWEDAVSGLVQYLESNVNLWNPETGVNQRAPYNMFMLTDGMISNSQRFLDIVFRHNFEFFNYVSQKLDIANFFEALKVSCTLGRSNAPQD